MAEIADSEFIFLDIKVYKSVQMYYEEKEIFEYLNFHPCQAEGKDFVRGKAQCLLGKESSCSTCNKNTHCY